MREDKLSDMWETPQDLFDSLNHEFCFDIDLCATAENSKCEEYGYDFFRGMLGYKHSSCIGDMYTCIIDKTCYMNPPYSNPKPFIEKAWDDSILCKIVCLIKCDPSTSMWGVFYNFETNKPRPGCEIRLLNKRVKYVPPAGFAGKTTGPSFPSCILIFDRR